MLVMAMKMLTWMVNQLVTKLLLLMELCSANQASSLEVPLILKERLKDGMKKQWMG